MPTHSSSESPRPKDLISASPLPWIVFLALILSAAYAHTLHYQGARVPPPEDFQVFYVGAKIAAQGERPLLYYAPGGRYTLSMIAEKTHEPGTLWDQVAQASGLGATLHFCTLPFTALILEPLSHVPWSKAYMLWCWLSALLLVASVHYTLRLARARPFWPMLAVFVAAGLAFFPYIQGLWLGQIDGLILVSWVLGTYLWSRGKPVSSAFCFAVGTMVKLTPALVAPLFLLRRQWRWLAAYCGWMAALTGVSIWRLGLENHIAWYRMVYPILSCPVPYIENRSLGSFLIALYYGGVFLYNHIPQSIPGFVCLFAKTASAGAFLGALYLLWKRNRHSSGLTYELIIMSVISLVVSPTSWRHYFVLTLLPLVYLWVVLLKSGERSFELKLLALVTLFFGLKIPEYLFFKFHLLSLIVPGSWVAVTILLFWLCLRLYDPATAPQIAAGGEARER